MLVSMYKFKNWITLRVLAELASATLVEGLDGSDNRSFLYPMLSGVCMTYKSGGILSQEVINRFNITI